MPVDFSAEKVPAISAKLVWGNAAGAKGYEYYRTAGEIGTYKNQRSFRKKITDPDLAKGKTYCNKVEACHMVGVEPFRSHSASMEGVKW